MQAQNQGADTTAALARADGVCNIQNFAFESSERISELRLHYSTLGTPQYDAAGHICNAVLLLHSSTGNRQHWLTGTLGAALYGPGQVLDASRYFIIVPDLIGHGQSSKPSDGLRTRFPRYRCRDIVNAVYLLVSQGLHIRQLQLVMGTSLGAMLAWLWGQMYPDSAVRLVPIGAYPLPLSGRNWIVRRMSIEAIRYDPAWHGGDYTEPPKTYLYTAPLLILLAHGVQHLHSVAPSRQTADQYYERLLQSMAQHDANDLLYVLESTQDFDPSPELEKITARVLAINFEGDEICRPDLSELDPALQRLTNAQFVVVPATQDTCGHFTYFQPEQWTGYLAGFLDSPDQSSLEVGNGRS